MILGVFIKQHKRSAHHTVLLVSHSSNLDLVCECFIYQWWATQTTSSQKNSKHKLGQTGYIYSRAIPPPLFFDKVPSSSYQVFQISFFLDGVSVFPFFQTLPTTYTYNQLLFPPTNADYRLHTQILQCYWEVSMMV